LDEERKKLLRFAKLDSIGFEQHTERQEREREKRRRIEFL
jgi:hypothetical protein